MKPSRRLRPSVFAWLAAFSGVLGCVRQPEPSGAGQEAPVQMSAADPLERVEKTDEEWKRLLTPEQFRITRRKGTERAFTGAYWDNKASGDYLCVACELPLFSSKTKYKSGTGWPSYWAPIEKSHVATKMDKSLFMTRVEVLCRRCDAHLGHVFEDGPEPTGLRYCINSAALRFQEKPEDEPPPSDETGS